MENSLGGGKVLVDESLAPEINSDNTTNLKQSPNLRTTDLVRLYLQEIAREDLLRQDEEISEAQKVQRYLRMRSLLSSKAHISDSESLEDMLIREALHQDLQHVLADLTDRERDVILMRFGLGGGHPYSLAEIGRTLNLSRERVRQIESKALQKLRQPKHRNQVKDYLEFLG